MSDPRPDLATAQRHVELVTGSPDTAVNVRLIHDGEEHATARRVHGPLIARCSLWSEIEEAQRAGRGEGLAVVNEGGDRAADITRIRALHVDGDDKPIPDDWHAEPDFLTARDDRHWHAYWCVEDLPVPEFKDAQRRLIARYDTDPAVCDPSRVMRLAGTLHLKDPATPRLVQLVDPNDGEPACSLGAADRAADLSSLAPPPSAIRRDMPPSPTAGQPIALEELREALPW